ncbi:MAG: 4-hydroxythreonine-4-phosphate dehydrogenase PdxA [Oscillospiraceae bacterium]
MKRKPILGILLGDATGVGPEVVAKLAANGFLQQACRPVLIGDARVFEWGQKIAGVAVPYTAVDRIDQIDWNKKLPLLDQKNQNPEEIRIGEINAACGTAVMGMLELAAGLCVGHQLDGFCFAPFNKSAMKAGGCPFESEHHLLAHIFGVTGPFGEINVLGELMTVRTTSHIPISEVSEHLSVESILRAIELGYTTVRSSGVEHPRLGVAALNPHCGEDGRCGREELDVIAPAIAEAARRGWGAQGPYSGDILFIKAFRGEFDAVVTMYHDQGQIALKLKGFDQGITVAGGQPYPIVTCAHGTAYDIAGKGIASTSAFENAVTMASKMAAATMAVGV